MRKLQGVAAALAVGSAVAAVAAPVAHGATIVARPVADATVFAGGRVQPAQRFLVVDGNPSAKAFLRWQLPGSLDGLQRATLELYSPTGGRGLRITTGRSPWSERSIRGKTPRAAALAGTIASARPGSWLRLDVTRFARAGGSLSFVVSKAGAAETRLSSREGAAAFRPRIKLFTNATPECGEGSQAATEDSPLDGRLSCRDDGALTYRQTAGATHGTLTIAGNGGYRYVPAANFNGADEFGYEACETGRPSRCAGGRLRLQLAPVNDAPVGTNVALTTAEDTSGTVAFSGSDIDGDPLSFSLVSQPGHGAAVASGNSVSYTPAANYSGPDSFGYLVSDGKGGTAGALASVTVSPVNDAPTAAGQSLTTPEDTAKALTLNGTDVDGDAVTFLIVDQPSHGALSGSGANRTYTPAADYHDSDPFTYRASDGTLTSELATVAITVSSVNDAPTAAGQSLTTPEDTAKALTLNGTDVDGDAVTFLIVDQPSHGVLSGSGANRTYTPAADYHDPDSFTYRASDGTLTSELATVSVTVSSVNDAPTANALSASTAEDAPVSITLSGGDVDGDSVSFLVEQPLHGAVSGTGANRTYTPAPDYFGADSFTYSASDGAADSNLATVSITVGAVNDPPTTAPDARDATEDTALVFGAATLAGNDAAGPPNEAGQALTVTAVSATPATQGTVTLNGGGNITYTPSPNFGGATSFEYTVRDDGATGAAADPKTAIGIVQVMVANVNDAPVLNTAGSPTLTSIAEDTASPPGDSVLAILARGAGGDPISDLDVGGLEGIAVVSAQTANGAWQFSTNDGGAWSPLGAVSTSSARLLASAPTTRVRFVPVANFNGSATFSFRAWDQTSGANGELASAAQNGDPFAFSGGSPEITSITVTSVNDAPVAESGSAAATEDTPATIPLTASDVDSGALTYSIVDGPDQGVLSGSGANRTYTPAADYNGPDQFRFRVSDGAVESNIATVSITVAAVNDAPVATDRSVPTSEETLVTITLLASDVEGSALSYAVVAGSGPTKGVLSGTGDGDNEVTYTPNPGVSGADSFRYLANDGSLDSNEATVSIDITSANDVPAAADDAYSVNEDGTLTVAAATTGVLANDVDPDGDPLTAVLAAGPAHGTLSLQPNGAFTYTPAADYRGPDTFTYRADDGALSSNLATVSIAVTSVNDAPTAAGQSLTTPEDTAQAITLSGGDADGDAISFVVEQPEHGTVSGAGASRSYTPAANYHGPDSFTFRTDDGTVQSALATVSIAVAPVNDAPVAAGESYSTSEDAALTVAAPGVLENDTDVDGDSLTAAMAGGPQHGSVQLNADGSFTYTPDSSYAGPDSFTYEANDGAADSAPATVSISVGAVNDPPVAADDAYAAGEDQTLVVPAPGVLSNDTDVDSPSLTAATILGPANGTLQLDADGSLSYLPNADFNGVDTFSYRASDGLAQSMPATVRITVAAVNDAPTANAGSATTPEDTAVTITLAGGDVDGDPIGFVVQQPQHGTVSGTGATRTYTPGADYNGPDSFTFRATDGNLQSAPATVTLTVTSVNDAPVAESVAVPAVEDTPVGIALTASDVDSGALTYSIVDGPDHGVLSGSGANRMYTPAADYNGPDQFRFRVGDGAVESNIATVSITVAAVNDAPVATDRSVSTSEETPVTITLLASDVEGASLSYSLVAGSGPTKGALSGTGDGDNQFTYTPNPGVSGADSFRYRASDGQLPSNEATVSVDIGAVNDAPVATDDAYAVNEDGTLTVAAAAGVLANDTDAEGASLSAVLAVGAAHGTLNLAADGSFTYAPAANYHGPDSFTYRANDGAASSNLATASIAVAAVNDAPTAADLDLATDEDTSKALTLQASDVDGDALSFAIVASPQHGALSGSGANRTYTPAADYDGADSFTYRASDGTLTSELATFAVTVSSVNDAPTANAASATTAEDTPVPITLSGGDVDGDTVSFLIVGQPSHGALSGSGASRTYTPAPDYFGSDSFTYRASDGTLTSELATVTVTVSSVNDAPVAAVFNLATDEDAATGLTLSGSDVDGDSLTFSIVSQPGHGALGGSGAGRTYTPAADYFGPDSFAYKVSDGTLESAPATVSIAVGAVNDAPLAEDASLATPEDTPRALSLEATDVDSTSLTYSIVDGPDHGTLTGAGASRTYTPATNYSGPDSFRFRANDGTADSNTATVTISVGGVNDAPSADDVSVATPEDTPRAVVLSGSDPEGAPLSFVVASNPVYGTLSGSGANRTYTPAPDYFGPDSFTYRANDGTLDSAPATVSITVSAVNDPPTAVADARNATEDTALDFSASTLAANDAAGPPNEAGQALTVVAVSGMSAAQGTVVLNGGGNITYTPASNFAGPASFVYTVRDNGETGGVADPRTATETVQLTVANVNDAPVLNTAGSPTLTATAEDAADPSGDSIPAVLTRGAGGDPISDVDTGALEGIAVTSAETANGTWQFSTNGGAAWAPLGAVSNSNARLLASNSATRLRFVPNPNFNGQTDFTFRAWDQTAGTNGELASAAQNGDPFAFSGGPPETASITVTPVNDAPVAENGSAAANEDTPATITLSASDVDSPSLTYAIVSGPDHGALSGSDANRTYTPAANYHGSDSFTFEVSDGTADSNVATVSITVAGVNDAPAASDRSVSTSEDEPVTITLQASDVEGSALSYAVVAGSGPTKGVLSGTGDGDNEVTYTPNPGVSGADSFRYLANDGSLDSNEATVSIDITSANDVPAATDDAYSVNEDGTLVVNAATGVLANDVDPDGDQLTAVLAAEPENGTLSLQPNGAFTYTPAADYHGPDTFTYRADDGTVQSAVATVSIAVTSVNDAPTAAGQSLTTPEDTAQAITLSGGDADGDALSFVVEQPEHGTVSGAGASRSYTPPANYHGPDSFTFRTNDGTVQSVAATVSIAVAPVNDAPVAAGESYSTSEDAALTVAAPGVLENDTDVDGDSPTAAKTGGPQHGSVQLNADGSFTYTPDSSYAGPDSFTYKANDGAADSAPATVSISVGAVNDPPAAADDAYAAGEDQTLVVPAPGVLSNDTDVDSPSLTATTILGPANGTLQLDADGSLSYLPNADFNGVDTFSYRASDGLAQSMPATVRITVAAVNDAPIAAGQSLTTPEDTAKAITLSGGDVDGDALSFVVQQPQHGTVSGTGATRTYTPAADYNGPDSFTFRATDGNLQSAPATVTLTVTSVNDAPTASSVSATTTEDTPKVFPLTGTDGDGDPITYLAVDLPAHGVVTVDGQNATYTPDANYNGPDSFTYRTSDGEAQSGLATVSLTVTPVNDAPLADDVGATTGEDQAVTIPLTASDVDGDPVTFSFVDAPSSGDVVISGTDAVYTPAAEFGGEDSFTFRAGDGTLQSNVATAFVIVQALNDAPIPADVNATTAEDGSVTITLAATDAEGDPISYVVAGDAAHGTVTALGGDQAQYTPDADYFGPDSFTYRANDGTLDSAPATVSITVSAVNDPPTAVADARNATEDTALDFSASTLAANDAAGPPNEAGQALTVVAVSGMPAAQGTVVLNGGNITYTPALNFAGPASFVYTVRDDGQTGGVADPRTATGTVELTVANVNDAPVLNAAGTPTMTAIAEDGADPAGDAIPAVLARGAGGDPISDADAGALEGIAVISAQTANGTWQFSTNGGAAWAPLGAVSNSNARLLASNTATRLRFVPNPNFNGQAEFTFRAWDQTAGTSGGTLSAAQNGGTAAFSTQVETVSIAVTPVNDAPVAQGASITIDEDTATAITLQASDVDSPSLTYTIVAGPGNGTLSAGSGATRTYTPNPNYAGPDSFRFRVSDGALSSSEATVEIIVNPVNDAPVAQNQSISTDEGTAKTITLQASDVEPGALTFAIAVAPEHGTLSAISGNQVVYTPSAGYTGPDSLTFTASDGVAVSNAATVSITVRGVNQAPVAADNAYEVAEDDTLTVAAPGVLGNDSDADGDPLAATVVAGPAHGTLDLNANGSLAYTPDTNYNGLDSFTYRANDGRDDSNVGTVTITVTAVNDAPACLPRTLEVDEDGGGSVAPSCSDVEGATLAYSLLSEPSKGMAALVDGKLEYLPYANANGVDSFTYGASDGTATSDPATVSVTIHPFNDAPEVVPQELSTAEGAAKAVTLEGFDEEGDALTFTIESLPTSGDLFDGAGTEGDPIAPGALPYVLASNQVTYRPHAGFSGTDGFAVTAHDGTDVSLPGEISIRVVGVNVPPVCTDVSLTVEEGGELWDRVCSDADGDDLTFTRTGPTHGTLSLFDDGNFNYVPHANYDGPDSFTVAARDPSGAASASATVSISVTPANDAPACLAVSLTTTEDTAGATLPDCEDVDGDVLTYSVVSQGTKGTASVTADGSLGYEPDANAHGADSFTYSASDGASAAIPVAVDVDIVPVNDRPVCRPVVLATVEDVAGSTFPDCEDVDGDALVYSVAAPATNGAASFSTGQLRYMPNPDFNGPDTVTYRARDAVLMSTAAGVAVTVAAANDAPVASGLELTTEEDTAKAMTLAGTDVEGDPLSFSVETEPAHGTLSGTGANRVYTPAADYHGPDSFTFRTDDGTAQSAAATVSLTVTPVNDAPTASSVSATTTEDTPKVFPLTGTDGDGDPITYLAVDLPAHGVLTVDGQNATYTPDANYNGPDSFTYRTSDGEAQSGLATVSLTVTPVNDAPTAAGQSLTTPEDTAKALTLNGTDVDGDAVSFLIVGQPSHGALSGSGANRTYTPAADYYGPDSFTYRASDGTLTSELATVAITVSSVNDAPLPADVNATVAEDGSVTITLEATDPDGDLVTYTVAPAAAHGSLSHLGGDQAQYTPDADYFGPDSFSFTASDGTGAANGLISLSVTPVNDAPALDTSGSPHLSPVNANASDPAGDTVAEILASGAGGDPITEVDPDDQEGIAVVAVDAAGGTWQYDPTGSAGWSSLNGASQAAARLLPPGAKVRLLPAAGFTGPASVEFRAWDQTQGLGGGSADTTVNGGTSPFSTAAESASIAVTPVANRAPVAVDDVVATDEDTPIDINVLADDSDPDGDALAVVSLTTPDDGIVAVNADGTVLYQPDPDTNGTDRFVYTVQDGRGGSATAEVDVTVQAVNDLPIARDDVERVSEDGMVAFDPTGNDVAGPLDESGGPITITGVTGPPANGTAEVPSSGPDAGKVRYLPTPGFEGADVFQYEICDDGTPAFCSEATVDMTVSQLSATVETAPVPHSASVGTDAADDVAIWVNPANPAESVVIGTNKFSDGTTNGGLLVYDLAGNQLQYRNDGRMNNVDLRDGFPLGGEEVTIVTSTERNSGNLVTSPKRIWVYELDPATRTLAPIHRAAPIVAGFEPLGTCMYRSPSTDEFYVFVVGKDGDVEQWRLFETAGAVDATQVRTFTVPDSSTVAGDVAEACVADDELGHFYIGEEDAGILKYSAEPDGGTTGTRVDVVGEGHMVADVEGLTIAYGPGGTGYLIASSQGDNSYAVYRREGDNEFVRRFKIKDGGTVDGTSETDGIDITTASLGPDFPNGVFVAQDNTNPGARQNYKLVPLEELFETGGLGANGSCARPYADSSPWNVPINAAAAVHPDSVAHVGAITGPLRSDPSQYTYPVYEAEPGTPLETVAIDGWYSNVTNGGRTLTNQRAGTVQFPIPAGAVAAAGGDAQLIVVDPRTGDEWGLSHAEQDATGAWSAWNAYHYNTRWSAVPPYDASGKPFFPRGAGVTYLAGLVRPCELERGRIDHALAFAYDFPTGDAVYPATKSDGNSAGFPDMPEGSRLRLDASLTSTDLANLGCTGHCLTIARALQKYGMYIIDNSGRPKVMLEYEGTAAWGGAVTSNTVAPIPLNAFQLLER